MAEPAEGDQFVATIDETVGWIIDVDLPDLESEDRERVVGHLTGALVARLYRPEPMTVRQIGILNSLVTFAAEHVPGGLSGDEREVARLVGKAALKVELS